MDRRLLIGSLILAGPITQAAAQVPPIWRHPVDLPVPALPIDVRAADSAIGHELGDLRERIDRGRDGGALSKRDARRFDREARRIGALGDRYGRDGLSAAERRELEVRTRVLREAIDAKRSRAGR